MKNEIFKPLYINNEQTKYDIGNYGTVINRITNHVLKPSINRGGYYYINISHNGCVYNKRIHRLVAETFIPNSDTTNLVINHIDGNKLNNYINNLEWCTSSQNNKHAYINKLKQRPIGIKAPKAKINDDIANSICKMLEQGDLSIREISEILNISKSIIEGILYRGYWSHVSKNYNIDFSKVKKDYGNKKIFSKLNEKLVLDILEMRDNGLKYKDIQKKLLPLYISKETLRRICNNMIHNDIFEKYQKSKNNYSSTTIENNDDYYTIEIH